MMTGLLLLWNFVVGFIAVLYTRIFRHDELVKDMRYNAVKSNMPESFAKTATIFYYAALFIVPLFVFIAWAIDKTK